MRLIRGLFWFLLLLVAGLVAGAFVIPERAAAERSIEIARPAAVVYALVDGYGRFNDWSPWAELDPSARYTFEGPRRGVGARMTWASEDPSVGRGEQSIVEAEPYARVVHRVVFDGRQESLATMTLEPVAGGTRVRWRLEADFPLRIGGSFFDDLVGRWFSTLLDRFVGADYERGLVRLKALAESLPDVDVAGLEVSEGDSDGGPAYAIPGLEATTDLAGTSAVLGPAIAELLAFAERRGIAVDGAPYTVIRGHADGRWQFDAAIPVVRNDAPGAGRVVATEAATGRHLDFRHVGDWASLETTHARAEAWLAIEGLREVGAREEHYRTDPPFPADATGDVIVRVYVD
jgi:uncharacterized protein YndB with AHSA1/START domain